MAAPGDVLETIELWREHANSDAKAKKALGIYMQWKKENPNGGGTLLFHGCGLTTFPPEIGALTSLVNLSCSIN